jgi:hypothetical protein
MERPALEQLPRRQAAWMAGSIGAAALLATTSLWAVQPEIALAVALGAGASCVDPRRLWASPLVVAAVVVAALASIVLGWPAVVGAGAVAGACATWLFPQRTGPIDLVHGALGGLAGASIGLWAATALVPAAWPLALQSIVTTGVVALVGSQGLLPVAVRFDQAPRVPSHRLVSKTLRVAYRPPVLRAIDLYTSSQAQAPDLDTRHGMAEVVTWVFRLQVTLQALDGELGQIDPEQVADRITRARASEGEQDAFVRERRLATVSHLERLLDHRSAIALERARSVALVDHAVAFLEEARAGLALAQHRPGETIPDRLPDVLRRLREHASDGEARRRTARELGS